MAGEKNFNNHSKSLRIEKVLNLSNEGILMFLRNDFLRFSIPVRLFKHEHFE